MTTATTHISVDLATKVHELDILTDELSSLGPSAKVYAKRIPSSKLFFLESKPELTERKKRELATAKQDLKIQQQQIKAGKPFTQVPQ